jgi:hypothetical protein
MTTRELLQMALRVIDEERYIPRAKIIDAIRAHLAKPEPEPIGEVIKATGSLKDIHIIRWADGAVIDEGLKLYTKDQL